MVFDTLELITLLIMLAAFIMILKAYLTRINTKISKHLWRNFTIVAGLMLLNRVFTNIEVLFWNAGFNFLEHLAMLLAGLMFLYITWKTNQEVDGGS
jgi:divalent metal cation (Fe/Co/Zn/Cd) transporter